MKKYLKIGITGAAILASGILCAFVLFKMRVIIELLKGITGILKPFLYGAVIAYLLAPLCNKIEEKLFQTFPKANMKSKTFYLFYSDCHIVMCGIGNRVDGNYAYYSTGMGQCNEDH